MRRNPAPRVVASGIAPPSRATRCGCANASAEVAVGTSASAAHASPTAHAVRSSGSRSGVDGAAGLVTGSFQSRFGRSSIESGIGVSIEPALSRTARVEEMIGIARSTSTCTKGSRKSAATRAPVDTAKTSA